MQTGTFFEENPPVLGAVRKDAYARPENSLSFPSKPPLVVLRGTWEEMGREYGAHVAAEIQEVVDGLLQRLEEASADGAALEAELQRYKDLLAERSPEMLEFITGISEGASSELQESDYQGQLDDMDKILLINCISSLDGELLSQRRGLVEEGTSWDCRGGLTKDGAPLFGANIDSSFYPLMYRLALVVIPDDPESLIYFSLPVAGCVSGPIGFNEKGLAIAATAVWTPPDSPQEGSDAGPPGPEEGTEPALKMPLPLLCAMTLSGAGDVDSAREILLHGPRDIAHPEKEKTLLPCAGANFLLADPWDSLALERDADHYGLKEAEQLEGGGSFLVEADHFTAPDSYAQGGEALGRPMGDYGMPEQDIAYSVVRLNSLKHLFQNTAKPVDPYWLIQEVAAMNYIYDDQGQKTYQAKDALGNTVSCLENGLTVNRLLRSAGSFYFGTVCSWVVDLESLDIWYELGPPSDWVGSWERINLNSYFR